MTACEKLKVQTTSTGQPRCQNVKGCDVFTEDNIMEHMVNPAQAQKQALTEHLMEEVCSQDNMNRAYKRVVSNKGAPGVC